MNNFVENQSKAYLKMKKKREAKRQAKLLQEEEQNNGKVDKTNKEPIDNEKQLRIKKIQLVHNQFINYLFNCISYL